MSKNRQLDLFVALIGDVPFRDDQDVYRGLRVDVEERQYVIALMDDLGRDVTGDDPAEQAVGIHVPHASAHSC